MRTSFTRGRSRILAVTTFLAFALPASLIGGSGQSGAPEDSTCAACHGASTTPLMSTAGGNGVFMTFSGGSTYTAGVAQTITVTVMDNAFPVFGYQTSPRIHGEDATEGAGTLAPLDSNAQYYPAISPSTLSWIAAGEGVGSPSNTFHFRWTPPPSGTVDFYVIGMGANGTGGPEPNEHVYANIYTLAPAPPPAVVTPSFKQSGVVSAAANAPGLTPGAWLAIYGQNLAQTTHNWNDSDFSSGALPTSLGGVSVMIDGKPAAVYYVMPTQIDVQVPDDATRGPVQVVVTSGGVASAQVVVNMAAFAPSFFTFDGKYIAATHADNTPISQNSPAKPGEVIVLYGTGFGPTNPPTPAGVLVSVANPLESPGALNISFNDAPGQVAFSGITSAGLYQFNLTVPATLADGDAKVIATIDSVQTQGGAFIPVHQ
jgi:uncharacterized protein (TIGR03437 family)